MSDFHPLRSLAEPAKIVAVTDEPEISDERGGLALIIYGVVWCLTVLPMLGIYALGNGMFGRSLMLVPLDVITDAVAFQPLALAIVILSLPIVAVPFYFAGRWMRRS
jgi:hypothetical protein